MPSPSSDTGGSSILCGSTIATAAVAVEATAASQLFETHHDGRLGRLLAPQTGHATIWRRVLCLLGPMLLQDRLGSADASTIDAFLRDEVIRITNATYFLSPL